MKTRHFGNIDRFSGFNLDRLRINYVLSPNPLTMLFAIARNPIIEFGLSREKQSTRAPSVRNIAFASTIDGRQRKPAPDFLLTLT